MDNDYSIKYMNEPIVYADINTDNTFKLSNNITNNVTINSQQTTTYDNEEYKILSLISEYKLDYDLGSALRYILKVSDNKDNLAYNELKKVKLYIDHALEVRKSNNDKDTVC